MSPADKLEHHLAREFVSGYINRALSNRKIVAIDPNAVFMAARFAGLKVSTKTLTTVMEEYRRNPT
jgi:hypothetical protein